MHNEGMRGIFIYSWGPDDALMPNEILKHVGSYHHFKT